MTASRGPVVLGIDLGTSSVKVVLLTTDGRLLAEAAAGYSVSRPRTRWSETDPALWWDAVRSAIGQLQLDRHPRPVAIGLSGQMHGVVVCDRDAVPIRPAMLWSDSRAVAQLDTYRALPARTLAGLGNPLSPGMAGPLLGWLAAEEPQVLRRASWALQPKDWIRARLTGRFDAEPSDASATLLYDLVRGQWDREVIDALRLDHDLFPPLIDSSGSPAGELLPGPAAALGLPVGIPVAAGAADTAAAALGSGLFRPRQLQLTIGTGAQLITPVAPPTSAGLLAAGQPVTHTYRAATETGWYSMAAVLNGGLTLDWVRRTLGVDWAELYAAADVEPGPDTDLPLFLPYLNGERTPHLDPELTASWTGLTARHDRTALLRSALEGVAMAIADARDALPDHRSAPPGDPTQASAEVPTGAPTEVPDIRIAGGGSLAPGWRQLLADVLGARLSAMDIPGASARGAAWTGALAAGLTDEPTLLAAVDPPTTPVAAPIDAHVAYYAERRSRYRAVFAALQTH